MYWKIGRAYCVCAANEETTRQTLQTADVVTSYVEEDPSILGSQNSPTEILALCTGLLPAAALAAARDTSELLKYGVAIVSITFRLAYEISRRMRLVEDAGGNWATTVVGMPADKAKSILDDFHNTQVFLSSSIYGTQCLTSD